MASHIYFSICADLFREVLPISQTEACPSIATVEYSNRRIFLTSLTIFFIIIPNGLKRGFLIVSE